MFKERLPEETRARAEEHGKILKRVFGTGAGVEVTHQSPEVSLAIASHNATHLAAMGVSHPPRLTNIILIP